MGRSSGEGDCIDTWGSDGEGVKRSSDAFWLSLTIGFEHSTTVFSLLVSFFSGEEIKLLRSWLNDSDNELINAIEAIVIYI